MPTGVNARSRCWALVGWRTCNVPLGEHGGIDHDFAPRQQKYRTHIDYTDDTVLCGWPTWMVWDIASSHGNSVRALIRKNTICQKCLQRYVFEQSREEFLRGRIKGIAEEAARDPAAAHDGEAYPDTTKPTNLRLVG